MFGIDPWAQVVGQASARAVLESAARSPVHAYLFLGSLGSGSFPAAFGFAGLILAHDLVNRATAGVTPLFGADEAAPPGAAGDSDGAADPPVDPETAAQAERRLRLAVEGRHPDVIVIEPEGATIRVVEAEQIIRAGLRSPVEAERKVIIVRGVDAIEEAAVGKLLKVVEEPPASTVFVLLAEEVPPELVTIASRCVNVEFVRLTAEQIEAALLARDVEPGRARLAALAAGGDVERGRLLATDDGLVNRVALWQEIPERLDGTGSAVAALVDELRAGMDSAQVPLEARHQGELAALQERVEQFGERGSGRAELVARQRRELRRLRSDELRFGLATLARVYRDRLIARPDPVGEAALARIQLTAENLIRNPNEALILQDLLLHINSAPAPAGAR